MALAELTPAHAVRVKLHRVHPTHIKNVEPGDTIAIPTLAWTIYKSCKDAPKSFKDITADVGMLHIVLKETDELPSDIMSSKRHELRVTTSCHVILAGLNELLKKFHSLFTETKRTVDRLRWT